MSFVMFVNITIVALVLLAGLLTTFVLALEAFKDLTPEWEVHYDFIDEWGEVQCGTYKTDQPLERLKNDLHIVEIRGRNVGYTRMSTGWKAWKV